MIHLFQPLFKQPVLSDFGDDADDADEAVTQEQLKKATKNWKAARAVLLVDEEPSYRFNPNEFVLRRHLQTAIDLSIEFLQQRRDSIRLLHASPSVVRTLYESTLPPKSLGLKQASQLDDKKKYAEPGDSFLHLPAESTDEERSRIPCDWYILDVETTMFRVTAFLRELACMNIETGTCFRSPIRFYTALPTTYDAVCGMSSHAFENEVLHMPPAAADTTLYEEGDRAHAPLFIDVFIAWLEYLRDERRIWTLRNVRRGGGGDDDGDDDAAETLTDDEIDRFTPIIVYKGDNDPGTLLFNLSQRTLIDGAKMDTAKTLLAKLRPRFISADVYLSRVQKMLGLDSKIVRLTETLVTLPHKLFHKQMTAKSSYVLNQQALEMAADQAIAAAVHDTQTPRVFAANRPTVNMKRDRLAYGFRLPYYTETHDVLHHTADADCMTLFNVLAAVQWFLTAMAAIQLVIWPHYNTLVGDVSATEKHDWDIDADGKRRDWDARVDAVISAIFDSDDSGISYSDVITCRPFFEGLQHGMNKHSVLQLLSRNFHDFFFAFMRRLAQQTNHFTTLIPTPFHRKDSMLFTCVMLGAPVVETQRPIDIHTLENIPFNPDVEASYFQFTQVYIENARALAEFRANYERRKNALKMEYTPEQVYKQAVQLLESHPTMSACETMFDKYWAINVKHGRVWSPAKIVRLVSTHTHTHTHVKNSPV